MPGLLLPFPLIQDPPSNHTQKTCLSSLSSFLTFLAMGPESNTEARLAHSLLIPRTAGQECCQAVDLSRRQTSRDVAALAPITMGLIQKYVKGNGVVGVD